MRNDCTEAADDAASAQSAFHAQARALLPALGMSTEAARHHMVDHHIRARGVRDPRVLAAVGTVPRESFLPAELADQAYEDRPLPIAAGQTISQP